MSYNPPTGPLAARAISEAGTGKFIQVTSCIGENYHVYLHGLDEDGRVWEYDRIMQVWVPLAEERRKK